MLSQCKFNDISYYSSVKHRAFSTKIVKGPGPVHFVVLQETVKDIHDLQPKTLKMLYD